MTYPQAAFIHTKFAPGSFIARKRDVVAQTTIQYQLDVLKKTGRYDAFKLKWRDDYHDEPHHWPVPNHLFWDSDIAKWIEGACYSLHERKDETIEAAVTELVEMIRKAQQPDGYLNIHFTVVDPKGRFCDLRDLHELYNAGHLIEAAIAHQHLYGNDRLLEPIVKYVELMDKTFGPGEHQRHGYPGHPEIELALLRLYSITKDQKHFNLAKYFVEERGNPTGQDGIHYYDFEAKERGERIYERPNYFPFPRSYWYQQAHKPILEQESVEGHSVRAMYLLTAVADLMDKSEDKTGKDYREALQRLWTNMVEKKMYLTGGIGAMDHWEGFGIDYFLPQSTDEGGCYAETCAGIGVMMLAERLLQLDLDGKFTDVMELAFYNAVLGGMSCNGKEFTYINQLASSDTDLAKREQWFTCACCPPNLTRLLGYLGGYLWSHQVDERQQTANILVHLFSSATLTLPVAKDKTIKLSQSSDWPWKGDIEFSLTAPEEISTTISIRIPGWSSDWTISPELPNTKVHKGYLQLPAAWLRENLKFTIHIPLKPRLVSPHPYTNQNVVALARGPLVYCVEDVDNSWVKDHFKTLLFDTSAKISENFKTDESTGETYVALTASEACSFLDLKSVPRPGVPADDIAGQSKGAPRELHFVPFYYRANRPGKGHMRVGLRRSPMSEISGYVQIGP